jgi:membrane protein DedA with SNARE-associated domain
MEETSPQKPEKTGVLAWLRKRSSALGGLLLSLAIVAAIILAHHHNPDIVNRLGDYGYPGAFVISVILNGTILFPVSNMAVMIALGTTLPLPWLVGIAGGLGAGIGEMTGYLAGRSGRGLLARSKAYNRVEGWVKRWGWLAVFVMSIVPFIFDVVGIIAGALRMPVWRFFIACWLGRTISYVLVIYLASLGLKVLPWFG